MNDRQGTLGPVIGIWRTRPAWLLIAATRARVVPVARDAGIPQVGYLAAAADPANESGTWMSRVRPDRNAWRS